MKFAARKSTFRKIAKLVKWSKLIALAKLAAIGTTITGALTALSGSATTGAAISAAGATTYAAAKGLPSTGYERTKHIPPGRGDKVANMLRQAKLEKEKKSDKPLSELPAGVFYAKQPQGQGASGLSLSNFPRKK